MSFDWLRKFQGQQEKAADYAEKKLAAYRLGMKAGGALAGVRIVTGENCCRAAAALPASTVYHPDEAPQLPLPGCPLGRACPCVYRPVMKYEQAG